MRFRIWGSLQGEYLYLMTEPGRKMKYKTYSIKKTKKRWKLKTDTSHVCLFTMTKRSSIKIRLLHLGKKITHTQRGGFIPPLLVNIGKTILASLFSNRKKRKRKRRRRGTRRRHKNRNCRKTAFFKKKMLRYRDNIVMVKLYRPKKVTLPNGKMEI